MNDFDNRLDFISNIEPSRIEEMTYIRERFINIDNHLMKLLEDNPTKAAGRTISLARTHLEIALQFAIKSLCLIGEIK